MTTTEVDVITWFVKPEDSVNVGSPLVEIESEKASTVLESEVQGVVSAILVQEGEVVQVGAVVCQIDEGR